MTQGARSVPQPRARAIAFVASRAASAGRHPLTATSHAIGLTGNRGSMRESLFTGHRGNVIFSHPLS